MNKLSSIFEQTLKAFTDWLGILGYAEATQKGIPERLKETLFWLQEKDIHSIHQISQTHIEMFLAKQETRPTNGGAED